MPTAEKPKTKVLAEICPAAGAAFRAAKCALQAYSQVGNVENPWHSDLIPIRRQCLLTGIMFMKISSRLINLEPACKGLEEAINLLTDLRRGVGQAEAELAQFNKTIAGMNEAKV